jgi:hypothetical protein
VFFPVFFFFFYMVICGCVGVDEGIIFVLESAATFVTLLILKLSSETKERESSHIKYYSMHTLVSSLK